MFNKSNNIYQKLEEKILSGEYQQGQRIPTENELCHLFGASRTSVRQALERLVVLGLLYKRQGSGTYVNTPDVVGAKEVFSFIFFKNETLQHILEFSLTMEQGNAMLAAKNRTDDNLKQMKKSLNSMNRYVKDMDKLYSAMLQFHLEIAKATQNPIQVKTFEILKVALTNQRVDPQVKLAASDRVLKDIANLYAAIEEKDSDLALHVVKRHVTGFIADIIE